MYIKYILKGLLTYIPGLYNAASGKTGGTNSARYCYSVWLRHLVIAHQNGLCAIPQTVAELGPGDSLGIGLAAMLSGAKKYYALDVVEYANIDVNLKIFSELVELFRWKECIPDQKEFPFVKPLLESYQFPSHILNDEDIGKALEPDRIESIKNAISSGGSIGNGDIEIRYFAPWDDKKIIRQNSVDMIFSQAVLEHVDELRAVYSTLYQWLKADGFMSHQIDFGSHGLSKKWNGHWGYSDFIWKLIKGKRPYLLNREVHSIHYQLLQQTGFKILAEIKNFDTSGITRKQLSSRFQKISEDDLTTRNVHVIARKSTS